MGKFRLVFISAASALAIGGCSVEGVWSGTTIGGTEISQNAKWESEFDKGKESLASGYLGLALERFKSALGMNPHSARVMNALAVTYDRLGRQDLAQLYYDRALAIEPNSATTLNNVGYSMLTRQRYEEALIYFEQALKQQQADAERRLVTANRQLALDRLRDARRQGGGEAIVTASVTTDIQVDRIDCRDQRPSAVGRAGARVFALITDPAEAGRSLSAGQVGRDCASDVRPRVAMIRTIGTAVAAAPPVPEKAAAPSAEASDRPAQVAAQPQRETAPKAAAEGLRVEVSNGAGRNKLAARMRSYFESKGLGVSYLTNAASFDNRRTTIFYKSGNRTAAEAFAKQLPIAVELVETNSHFADIRIRLGADILEFDRNTLYAATIGEPNV